MAIPCQTDMAETDSMQGCFSWPVHASGRSHCDHALQTLEQFGASNFSENRCDEAMDPRGAKGAEHIMYSPLHTELPHTEP